MDQELCEYERLRLKNQEENRRMLQELGLLGRFQDKEEVTTSKKKHPRHNVLKIESKEGETTSNRRSPRQHKPKVLYTKLKTPASPFHMTTRHKENAPNYNDDFNVDDDDSDWIDDSKEIEQPPKRSSTKKIPNQYGAIEGVEVGREWMTRLECSVDGVHRLRCASIHYGPEGAYSLALSGGYGYEGEVDEGDYFTYSGERGKDLEITTRNSMRTKLALSLNFKTKQPVRVIRSFQLESQFAPENGYRYDGLYTVEDYKSMTGRDGYRIIKFGLKRCENQELAPWKLREQEITMPESSDT